MSRPPANPAEAIAMLADASCDLFDRDVAMRMIDDDPAALPALVRIASDPAEPEMLQQSAASAIGCIWQNQDRIDTGDDSGFTPVAREEIALFRKRPSAQEVAQRLTVRLADYRDPFDAGAVFMLLNSYAKSVQGGGKALDPSLRDRLAPALAEVPGAFTLLALEGGTPIGLANCFTGFSTFACAPLVNIHDMAVVAARRGCGVGRALMRAVEAEARKRGACKITLEVLAGNEGAKSLYASEGYATYALDPAMGSAQFWEKKL
ncbi:GNAT family N-acetyltransferase [Croceicoccus sp. BE223]|uniref:GNAT family N-acetyltransferase n=1 Tax=Croceicoccus sp. BE223 TaxID=2817716 RepID=UPI002859CC49|nr:GNAT family N-acetyltransferase [Croceicoccus sp. BE223]MDR7102261.1 GNAT superfamily N-acetyltransferase [Croceicoccus sp. BE223]